jgi:hypothetical protein
MEYMKKYHVNVLLDNHEPSNRMTSVEFSHLGLGRGMASAYLESYSDKL